MGELTPSNGTVPKLGEEPPVSRQPIDYFAEQNQKREEQRQKLGKVRKWGIIIGGIVVVLVIAVIAVVLVVKNLQSSSGLIVSDDASQSGGEGNSSAEMELSSVDKMSEQVNEIYEPSYSVDENGNIVVSGNLEEVEAAFAASLKNPANQKRLDTIRLTQIIFYSSIVDRQRVVEIAAEVDPSRLNMSERLKFYNLTYLAYAALGDSEQATHYYLLMKEVANKVSGYNGE